MKDADSLQLSPAQRQLWPSSGGPRVGAAAHSGAVRVTGDLTVDRLLRAINEVIDTTGILRAAFADGPHGPVMTLDTARPAVLRVQVSDDDECLQILLAHRDAARDVFGGSLIRIHLLQQRPRDLVLAVTADPLLLDLRSVYLLLGTILQAAVGRYRQDPALDPQLIWPLVTQRQARLSRARRAWWTDRLTRWSAPAPWNGLGSQDPMLQNGSDRFRTRRLSLPPSRSAPGSTARWSEMIGALAWAMGSAADASAVPPVVIGGLDLRDVLGLPPAMGPLTDHVLFDVDLNGLSDPAAVVIRAHASMLDAVVHHVPYAELDALGRSIGVPVPPQTGHAGHVVVHHCRSPISSRHTRGDPGLGRLGLSVELFGQAALVSAGTATAPLEIHLAETGTDLELILDHDPTAIDDVRVDALVASVSQFLTDLNDP